MRPRAIEMLGTMWAIKSLLLRVLVSVITEKIRQPIEKVQNADRRVLDPQIRIVILVIVTLVVAALLEIVVGVALQIIVLGAIMDHAVVALEIMITAAAHTIVITMTKVAVVMVVEILDAALLLAVLLAVVMEVALLIRVDGISSTRKTLIRVETPVVIKIPGGVATLIRIPTAIQIATNQVQIVTSAVLVVLMDLAVTVHLVDVLIVFVTIINALITIAKGKVIVAADLLEVIILKGADLALRVILIVKEVAPLESRGQDRPVLGQDQAQNTRAIKLNNQRLLRKKGAFFLAPLLH